MIRFTGPQILHQSRRFPAEFKETERISLISSFLPSILLGKYAPIEASDASGMNLLDLKTKGWDPVLLNLALPVSPSLLGIPDSGVCSVLGSISPYFSSRYSFPKGISYLFIQPECKIISFTGDNPSTLAGLSSSPSDIYISLGTSDTLFFSLDSLPPDGVGHVFCHPVNDKKYMGMLCFKNGSLVYSLSNIKGA
jgi:xylulokinase